MHRIITEAVDRGVSDIHFEPQDGDMRVRYRIDGVLRDAAIIPENSVPAVASRVKILSDLDIAERRIPQDGRISLELDEKHIDLRVATLPSAFGENIVMRILDSSKALIAMETLGMLPQALERFTKAIGQAHGAVLVTGPTGSGKSTSLYAALNVLNTVEKNIITIEDPVEYQLEGITQVQTNPRAGLTFSSGLRSMMRADPDIIMVGEIRDRETAQIAIEAALTGHLVLSTLHTNDAPGAVSRLIEMGIEPFLVGSAVDCVVAQRLARLLCEECKRRTTITSDVMRANGFNVGLDLEAYEPVGCARCGGSGYKGRIGLYEVMWVSETIRALAVAREPSENDRARRRARGHDAPPRGRAGEGPARPHVDRRDRSRRRHSLAPEPALQVAPRPADTETPMNFDFSQILIEVVRQKASDLHLTSGSPPMLRKRGQLVPMEGLQNLTPTDTREIIYTILNSSQRQRLETDWQLDFAYSVPGQGRFRVNAYFQRGSLGAAFRLIPNETVPIEKLGLPPVVRGFAKKPRGIVLVTGPTGSGKSTTLASIINEINETRDDHILTIEDPIEFLHSHKKCIVNQREIGTDAQTFAMGLKAALRQDPDVILVGEMRDMETIGTALTAAETGHLVFATLHTQDAPQTVDRIIDVFPPEQQGQVRAQLSIGLQGVVTQTLVPTADGNGRCVAAEVLVPTPGVRNLIREGKTHQIYSLIQTGGQHGMQTMDTSLAGLVKAGHITMAAAESRSSQPAELRRLVENADDLPMPVAA